MTVKRQSVFPATRKELFSLLQQLKTLRYIAKPYASFTPVNGEEEIIWQEGERYALHFKLFGVLPLGIHTIRVMEFSPSNIYTYEGNPFVPIWNHRIVLREKEASNTEYTDEVEIGAGWKTPFVYLWAKAFYTHRQKKWHKLLREYGRAKQMRRAENGTARKYRK